MKLLYFLIAIAIAGCVSAEQAARLTPEQMSAWAAANHKRIICVGGSGPLGAGSATFIVVPPDATGSVKFGPGNCTPSGEITLGGKTP